MLLAARHALAEHGWQGSTIESIARAADVSRQAVYEQFGDRDALFAAAVADVEERVLARAGAWASDTGEPDLRCWIRANYRAMFDLVAEYPDTMPVLAEAERCGNPALSRLRTRLAEVYAAASRQRWAAYGVEPGRADTALVTMYLAMTESLVNLSWQGAPPDRDALVDLLTEFTLGGLHRLHEREDVIDRLRGGSAEE